MKQRDTVIKALRQKGEWDATEEILSDNKFLAAWRKGKREIETGKTENWESVKKRLFVTKCV